MKQFIPTPSFHLNYAISPFFVFLKEVVEILLSVTGVRGRFEEGSYDQVIHSREHCGIDDYSSHLEVG